MVGQKLGLSLLCGHSSAANCKPILKNLIDHAEHEESTDVAKFLTIRGFIHSKYASIGRRIWLGAV